LASGEAVLVSIRPEHFLVSPAPPHSQPLGEVEVESVAFLGTYHQARTRHLSAPGFRPTVMLPQASTVRAGDRIGLHVGRDTPVVLKG
jgi:spermidine/putrescine transport system ATP-binding protein